MKDLNSAPLVSIIMSVYDGDDLLYVQECIQSIFDQTFTHFEIILVDDGIKRKDLKMYLNSLPGKDSRIKLIANEKNSGLAYSMNQAIKKGNGKYYARMDADDLMLPDRILKQVTFLDHNPSIDIVGSFYYEINDKEIIINEVTLPIKHAKMVSTFPRRNPLAHVSVMMRREFIAKSGLYPLSLTDQDTLMWVNGIKNSAVLANLPEFLLKVRVSNDFYKRRAGYKKALNDAKNRAYIIRELKLSKFNFFYVGLRFLFQLNPFHKLTHLGYKYLR